MGFLAFVYLLVALIVAGTSGAMSDGKPRGFRGKEIVAIGVLWPLSIAVATFLGVRSLWRRMIDESSDQEGES
jgi:hypothetical protein